jgi:hypothetical protein
MKYLEMLKVYFESRGDFDSFKKVLNTKNTRGYTTLDYVKYCHDTLRFASVEEKGLNLYVKFLCENGAEYSLYNNATCPVPYMKINY